MQPALRPNVSAASVAVLGAGLIYVTPVAAPHIAQQAVQLAAAEGLSDLAGPVDAVVSSLGGLNGELSGVLPSLGDLSGTLADAASSLAGLDSAQYLLLDPAFWQEFWNALLDPNAGESAWLMLTGATEQLPVVGPLLEGFGLFVVFPVSLLLAYGWSLISEALGIPPYAAAAEGLFSDATGLLDPTTLVQDVTTALDPSALTSVVDLNPIADIGAVFDPAGFGDLGASLSIGTIPDLGGILTSLIP